MAKMRALILKGVNSVRPRDANIGGQPSEDGEARTGEEETGTKALTRPVGVVGESAH